MKRLLAHFLKLRLLHGRISLAVEGVFPGQRAYSESMSLQRLKQSHSIEVDFAVATEIPVMHEADYAHYIFEPQPVNPIENKSLG